MATYQTEIGYGGGWHEDANLEFFDDGKNFSGSAQFPNEGPVGYRGSLQ